MQGLKPMLEGNDSARTFNLNIDSAVEVGDKASFSFTMFMKNKHPDYYPWHMMVVTKEKMTEIKMNGEVLAK